MNRRIKLMGISGSLRENSSNTNILKQMASMMPDEVELTIYNGIGELPHFSPEFDTETPPTTVEKFRSQLTNSDGIIICTPEYAFGVPGTLKNALDWTVSSGEFVNKPLALITASLSGEKAHASLLDTLTALSAAMAEERILLIPFIRSKIDEQGFIRIPELLQRLQSILQSFITTHNENHSAG